MKKTKQVYEKAVNNTKSYTKEAIRMTKLTMIGTCLIAASLPLAYMAACEDYLDAVSDKIKPDDDEGDDEREDR